jgi:hypothetical protein
MTKRRIRFGLGAWIIGVTVLCVGAAVAILVVAQVREREAREARAGCIANLQFLESCKVTTQGFTIIHINGFRLPQHRRTNIFCPLAIGTNRTPFSSYDIGDATTPPTCRICPEEHVLP